MDEICDKVFRGETIDIDGHEFVRCTFENCVFRYSGGECIIDASCSLSGVTYAWSKQVADTIILLAQLGLLQPAFARAVLEDVPGTIH